MYNDLKAQGVYEGQDYLPSVYNVWIIEEETERTPRWSIHGQLEAKAANLKQVQLCGRIGWKCRWILLSTLHEVNMIAMEVCKRS